jgi:hypothetical protein
MVVVRLETSNGCLVGKVEIMAFDEQLPDVVLWGNRVFTLVYPEPDACYRECFFAISLTTPERCVELSGV